MNKIAIACQGGGSHTAFTAGVLKTLLKNDVHKDHRLVGLSGTSGGAVCALLTWYSLLRRAKGDQETVYDRLIAFWKDNTAQLYWEQLWNAWSVGLARLQSSGVVPEFKLSPYASSTAFVMEQVQQLAPRREFLDFAGLLNKHVQFEGLETLVEPSSPRLLLGAVDVLSGKFKAFDSLKREITLHATLASAAIPTLFRAVEIDGQAYWDGLFSENPPINSFLEHPDREQKPDEIWIIQINPTRRKEVPQSTQDILDRHNELAGNLSLFHAIQNIQRINEWIERGFTEEHRREKGYQPVKLRRIATSAGLTERLDSASKIDRSELHIDTLIEDGELQAEQFLRDMDGHEIPREGAEGDLR